MRTKGHGFWFGLFCAMIVVQFIFFVSNNLFFILLGLVGIVVCGSQMSKKMRCPNCGAKLNGLYADAYLKGRDSFFCPGCGAEVQTRDEPPEK